MSPRKLPLHLFKISILDRITKIYVINLSKNFGKGYAVKRGTKESSGEYILLQDADLELDIKDSKEIYEIISIDEGIDCIFKKIQMKSKK